MVNRWTGAHDAVLELAPAGVDRLLAALHRKGDPAPESPDGPHIVHSAAFNLPFGGAPAAGEPDLRGHLRVQVSTPSVDVPAGAGPGRVRVSVQVYSWFRALPKSAPAPEFLHGTLALTVGARVFKCHGETLAEISLAADDVQVEFTPAPGSGATAADVALVHAAVPAILRKGVGSAQFSLGGLTAGTFTVRDLGFKTLRTPTRAAFALLLSLSAPGGPLPNPDLVKELFLSAGDDAAVALGKEFLTRVITDLAREPLSAIKAHGSRFIGGFGIGFTVSFDAKVDPDSLKLIFGPGRIRVQVSGSGSLSPGGSFKFRVTQDFGLIVHHGRLRLVVVGGAELDITEGNPFLKFVLWLVEGLIENALDGALNGVITQANDELNRVLDDSVGGLLARVSLPVELAFTHASVDGDAVIIGGRFDLGPAPAVVARFTEHTTGGLETAAFQKELDGFESWIPGGTIERYRWKSVTLLGTVTSQLDELHRFVARILPSSTTLSSTLASAPSTTLSKLPLHTALGWPPTSWCVEVHGTQLIGSGTQAVSGSVCGLSVLVVGLDLAASHRLTISVPDGEGGVLADVDPWGGYRPHAFAGDTEARGFLLVSRPGDAWNEIVPALRAGLASLGPKAPVVLATLIADGKQRDAGKHAQETPELALTADPEGAWSRRFKLESGGTVLVGPGGKELWRARGAFKAEELERVLAGILKGEWGSKPRLPRQRALGLALGLGTLAPDFAFPCDGGVIGGVFVGARKLRGRDLTVVFWTTWSEPALEELRRVSASGAQTCGDPDRERPLVMCVNDGEPAERAAAVLKERGLDVTLIPDPERALAKRYGVTCWPTVVRIDGRGRIAHVRLGLERGHGAAPKGEEPAYWAATAR